MLSLSVRIAALIVSMVGVSGELILIRHELVNCYPFKMMSYPPGEFYEQLGNIGIPASLVALLVCTFIVAMRRPVIAPALMTAVAPLACVALVAGLTVALYGFSVPAGIRNFDGYSITEATGELAARALGMSVLGALIGAACGAFLSFVSRYGINRETAR